MTAAAASSEPFDNAAIAYRFALRQAVRGVVEFVLNPTPANQIAVEQAAEGQAAALIEVLETQNDRHTRMATDGQIGRLLLEEVSKRHDLLEELTTEVRDEQQQLSRLIAAFIKVIEDQNATVNRRLDALERQRAEPGQPWRNEP